MSEDKIEAHNAAQGTAKTEFDSNATRTVDRSDNMSVVILANSQRFRNLNMIYDQLTLQINQAELRYSSRAPAKIAVLPCNCNACCRCSGRIARNILCGMGA
jgi:hypothetical protein